MMITINSHTVEFAASGRIFVDGRAVQLIVRMTNGGHYTALADAPADATAALAGRKLTGPRRPVGSYEQNLAHDIIAALHPQA